MGGISQEYQTEFNALDTNNDGMLSVEKLSGALED